MYIASLAFRIQLCAVVVETHEVKVDHGLEHFFFFLYVSFCGSSTPRVEYCTTSPRVETVDPNTFPNCSFENCLTATIMYDQAILASAFDRTKSDKNACAVKTSAVNNKYENTEIQPSTMERKIRFVLWRAYNALRVGGLYDMG